MDEVRGSGAAGLDFKDPDERRPDPNPLFFRVDDPLQRLEELLPCIH